MIGYACMTVGVRDMNYRTCIRKNATVERLREIIAHNLSVLDRMLDYNYKNDIRLFRISSEIIPFGSSPVNQLDWLGEFAEKLRALGEKAKAYGMRLSTHPGQYTVLNSPDPEIVRRAVLDLVYHCDFLDALELGQEHKMILHIGGMYGNKEAAVSRFIANYKVLPGKIKKRLVIENDDKVYPIEDVYRIGLEAGIPVVFDNLHHEVNPGAGTEDCFYWLEACKATWKPADGSQKMHYSEQAQGKRHGSHSDTIHLGRFLDFYERLGRSDIDVMLEVKDKNLSAVKCVNAVRETPKITFLEQEWAKYKYTVLERSPQIYGEIRALLRDKTAYPARIFYTLLEEAMEREPETGHVLNAMQHVWGYFKHTCEEKEKKQLLDLMGNFRQGIVKAARVKKALSRLAEKYHKTYLLESYYFN